MAGEVAHGVSSNEKSSSSPVPYDEATASVEVRGNTDALQRHLGNRQIQMIAIGGSIGTALFVSIGNGLINGGPGSLLIAYALYSGLLGLVNNCMAEMAVFMPISGTTARATRLHSWPHPADLGPCEPPRLIHTFCWEVGR